MRRYIGFDIGGTNVKHGIVTAQGEIEVKGSFKTDVSSEEVFVNSLVEQIELYKKEYNVEGIAISMPGFIDTFNGIPTVCYAINCLEGKSITKILENRTGLKAVVENDGNCVALAEKFNGHAVDCSDFICITVGTGIGGGIYVNNDILRGKAFKGGEFGYMICRDYNENNLDRCTLSTNAATLPLINFYKEYMGIQDEVEGQEVFVRAKEDEKVQHIIDEWFKSLALGIFNLCATLNPEKVLIGGAISSREDFVENLVKALNAINVWKDVEVPIEVCKHRNDAGLIGAVYNFANMI
ncbi:MAG: ROK family protein [Clostridium sp.]